jgi:hypothetical protein
VPRSWADQLKPEQEFMDPEFQRLVDAAAEVATSGRWEAVNDRIKALAPNPGPDPAWHVQLLGCLCSQTFSEYLLLKRAYADERNRDSSLLAWRARTLLELSVWSLYCAKDRTHARRIYEDAGRDVIGIYIAFEKWGTATVKDADFLALFSSAKQELSSRAAADGIASLDGDFKKVNEAAEEVGLGEHFRLSYKMLSKFAHPTAMRILAPPDEPRTALRRDCFFSQGCLYFRGAFDSLENQLRSK